ncbi:MAG: Ppx/GppA family phosphatase [Firmicutes bacterium]|nr:Ppx/GppA family phosphatase [Bacillota bacterium]
MRVGVIDVGTNSVRLLVADVNGRRVATVRRALAITRLGEGIGDRMLRPAAISRTLKTLAEFRELAAGAGAEKLIVVGTSAVREAENRREFVEAVREGLGLEVRVLSGYEEARLGFLGAVTGLPLDPAGVAVVDVGGGSTEVAWLQEGTFRSRSLPLGAVRMTEGGWNEDAARSLLAPVLEELRGAGERRLVGVGGTVTTLAAVAQRLEPYDPERVHGYPLEIGVVAGLLERLAGMDQESRRRVPGLQPERADIIVAGTRIVLLVMAGLGAGVLTVSEHDLLHGVALTAGQSGEKK